MKHSQQVIMNKKKSNSSHNNQPEVFWPRIVMRKWLNIAVENSDFSADTEDDDETSDHSFASDSDTATHDALPRIRRRKSETCRAQYINTKEIRICAATWNVGGKLPPDDLDIGDWIDSDEPADIYVLGLQEIVPLNAGNILGAEDNRPVTKWENIIRENLNCIRPVRTKVKCYSDPPSPSKFKPSDELPDIEEEILLGSDSDIGEEIYPLEEEPSGFAEIKTNEAVVSSEVSDHNENKKLLVGVEQDRKRQFSSPKRLDRLNCLLTQDREGDEVAPNMQQNGKLTKMLSGTERIGLSWPERPLDLLSRHVLQRPNSFKSVKSFKATKSFGTYSSFKFGANKLQPELSSLAALVLEALVKRKRRPSSYVRILSKQMVGIFLTIWVRRSLRKHIQNVKVSTVGVGVMGYIGNKGSISVSMSIYQTLFCFICTHLTAGEKDGDEIKRNADVYEIHRRTQFHSLSGVGLPKRIYDHERIIWLGDLNYRINLSYEKTCELISKSEWSKLQERDQLIREQRKGRAFDGWSEGTLNFSPTYKYEMDSDKYYGEDPKVGRRNPAWCDRILSYGKGVKLLKYRRTELKLSDHRPVTAAFMVEVEVFCPKKLQRALTFTDAEIEDEEVVTDLGIDIAMGHLRLEQENSQQDL